MFNSLLIYLILSNALSIRRDRSIMFLRTAMTSWLKRMFIALNTLFLMPLDRSYAFIASIVILISVVSAVYYLNLINKVLFFKPDYVINPSLENLNLEGIILKNDTKKINFKLENLVLGSASSNVISVLTLILLLFIYIPDEWFRIANILTIILFKP